MGIPIAIHLLQLRRYRKVYFSNVDILDELQSENRRQSQLRKLLILAARILAIVFLVLAFCQPVIPNRQGQMHSGATVVSVYVDNSYSMECGGMDGSLMESAKAKAREIVAAYRPSDRFQLLTNDATGSQFRWLSREDFLEAVDELEVSSSTTMLSAVTRRQNEFLMSSTAANRHAFVISDFQRATADVQNLEADSAIQVTYIPLGGTQVDNIFIDSVSFDAPAYFVGATVKANVSVSNCGGKPIERLPLRLFAGGKQCALASVDIPAHASAQATLTFTIPSVGALQGYVETTDYPITFDDRLYFTLDVQQQLPMLVISGREENPFLRRMFAADSLVSYHQSSSSQVNYSGIENHRFIVVDEFHSISSGMAQTLREFMSRGGSLLLVPAADAELSSYNQFLSSVQAPLFGAWSRQSTRVADVQYGHKLYTGVFQGQREDMELPTVMGHYILQPSATTVAQPVASLNDGSHYLVSLPVGKGTLYLVTSPLRAEYTDFVRQALFVPTVYNMALYSTPLLPPYHLLSSIDPIILEAQGESAEVAHLLSADSTVDIIPDIRNLPQGLSLVPHGQLSQAGNYLLTPSGQGLSFNYDRQESILDFFTPAELSRTLRQMSIPGAAVVQSPSKNMTDYVRIRTQGTPLWRYCLVLVLLMLLAETVLIRYPKHNIKSHAKD